MTTSNTENLSHFGDDELPMSKKNEQKQDVADMSMQETQTSDLPEAIEPEAQKSTEEKLHEELALAKDRLLRLGAEYENFKKISQREQQNSIRFANESLIVSLLPIVDNLEQAIAAQKKSTHISNNEILIGIEMVLKQFLDVLNKFGVETFSAQGMLFDPARHEALCEQEDNVVTEGTVVTEYQKGYVYNGRLLRPARVAVAKKSGNK
jgi:molecular chaperone GrpE